jgi:hypothetical protein
LIKDGGYFPGREMRLRKATNRAAPRTAQIIGKTWEPNFIDRNSGSSNFSAIKVPIKAPIKPSTMEVKQPTRFLPANLAPITPLIKAIKSKNKKEKKFIYDPL